MRGEIKACLEDPGRLTDSARFTRTFGLDQRCSSPPHPIRDPLLPSLSHVRPVPRRNASTASISLPPPQLNGQTLMRMMWSLMHICHCAFAAQL